MVEHLLGRVSKGAYFKDLGVIVIGPNLHPYKKRNLIAHGLAHHLFHRERKANYFINDKDFIKGLNVKKMEKEAEVFVAYFLIPEEKLNVILKKNG